MNLPTKQDQTMKTDNQQSTQLKIEGRQLQIQVDPKVSQDNDKIQCCLIADLIKQQNAPIREQIFQTLCQSSLKIKEQINKNCDWGAVAYGGNQTIFTAFDDASSVEKNLKMIQPIEAAESPEDLKKALQKALEQTWTEKIKFVIIITGSPCFGTIYQQPYTNQQYNDFLAKSEDNMEEIIETLIEKNIYVLGIRFLDENLLMYHEIANIYNKHNKAHMFMTQKISNIESLWNQEIPNIISEVVAIQSTQYNQQTFVRSNEQDRQIYYMPAIQDRKNLCQEILSKPQSDWFINKINQDYKNFIENVQPIQESHLGASELVYNAKKSVISLSAELLNVKIYCNFYTIQMAESVMSKFKKDIYKLKQSDFIEYKECNLILCLKTEQQIGSGLLKEVHLMKMKGYQEHYILKIQKNSGPYSSMGQALMDCKAHLIAQTLMIKFMQLIRQKSENLIYPDFSYSNLIIVEELNKNIPTQYWIAEKIQKEQGQFKKYNNNNGFILNENTLENELAQAFTCFTYLESDQNFMICDIQGFERQLTDPVINTIKGIVDVDQGQLYSTDYGEVGIKNYLQNLKQKGFIGKQLLETIGIKIN